MSEEQDAPKKRKPKIQTKSYTLLVDLTIGDVDYKKGDAVNLTDKAARFFIQKKRIKNQKI